MSRSNSIAKCGMYTAVCVMALAGPSGAVIIKLTNQTEGSQIVLDEGLSDEVHVRLYTTSFDTIPVAFVNAFLDVSGPDLTELTALTPGMPDPWEYDRSAFTLPAAISEEGGNEYGLISGDQTPGGGYPLGIATYIHDALTLTQTTFGGGDLYISFELGARAPQVFGSAPTYTPFTVAPPDFIPNLPNFLYIGDINSNNSPFLVQQGVPEPSLIGLLILSAIPRRRRRTLR